MTELSPTGGSEGYGACDGVTTLRSYDSRASGDRECPHRQGCVANMASNKSNYHTAAVLIVRFAYTFNFIGAAAYLLYELRQTVSSYLMKKQVF